MTKWEIIHKNKSQKTKIKSDEIIQILLQNRGIKTKRQQEKFLNPKLSEVTWENVGISKSQLLKTVKRINAAIKHDEQIVVFGDYDVDGVCGSAILWETLNRAGAKVLPYIPNRIDEGYGLSVNAVSNLKSQIPNVKLIITVDNGIVAQKPVKYAKSLGIDVIITDHHVPGKTLPKAFSIVHTTKLCGAGVAYMLSLALESPSNSHLELVVLATIADLVSLKDANRTFVKFGLAKLHETKRPGILALCKEAGININQVGVYEIGHIIAPRLNAMGRLDSAMDSLRLICTLDPTRAKELAFKLGSTNKERQQVTEEATLHARQFVRNQGTLGDLLFVSDKSYQQGVIGLVAGKLVEEFYLPSIVVSEGKTYSKASARSIAGFNIVEFIRSSSDILEDVGGHPMAAGFTVETKKISLLKKRLTREAAKFINEDIKKKTLKIDCELNFPSLTQKFYDQIQTLAPFGVGNSQPVFISKDVLVANARRVGNDKHLKLKLSQDGKIFDAIFFAIGERNINTGDKIDVVYLLDENIWNGNKSLQLKIRDFK